MKIIKESKINQLAADMILVALRDLKHPDTTLEAALWFFGPDYGLWAEVAGIPFVAPLTIIRNNFSTSRARNLCTKIERVVNKYQFVEVLGEDSGYSRRDVARLAELIMPTLERIAGPKKKPGRKIGKTPNRCWRIKREERNANKYI